MEAWIDMIFGPRRAEIWSVSPHHNLKPGLPPALAFRGSADSMVLPYTVDLFAVEMRKRRRDAAEKQAQKAPVKILFPLIFLILPAFVVSIMTSPIIRIFESLGD